MRPDLAPRWLAAAAGAAAALPPLILLRGFTVDDAWIPARYAAHLASGLGYRFNPAGPPTDGVTPLPWAPLLAPAAWLAAPSGVEGAWLAARWVGVACWLASAALLGRRVASIEGSGWRALALLPLAVAAAPGAWAWAGLETGAATLLATLAVCARSPGASALAAGLAAALRPEMVVFALAWASALALSSGGAPSVRSLRLLALAAGPWLLVVAVRLLAFGRPFPLSVLAKPSDFHHGAVYALAGLLLLGPPWMALAPAWLLRPEGAAARRLALAALAHAAAVAWAGGDWMPLSRLLVPSVPAWVLASAHVAAGARPPWTALRALVACAAAAFVWWRVGAASMGVVPVRAALIEQARAALAPYRSVASLDAGWVGAATSARVVDLAGLTDPALASLPGGHTSKRVTGAMLADRGVEALLLLRRRGCEGGCVRDDGGPYERQVEERLARDPWITGALRPRAELRSGVLTYVLWAAPEAR